MNTAALSRHPCFNATARATCARIHLPVAPACNVQCRFCNRCYDCANESRPGVTSAVLSPQQALAYLHHAYTRHPNITVVGIAGPGDPLADADKTFETLRGVRAAFPNMLLCVATNGLTLAPHVDELAALRVSHVTVTVNAVDPAIGAQIYAWVRPDKKPFRGVDGAAVLWERQQEGLRRLVRAGIILKINTVVIPGINDAHVLDIARTVKEIGAHIMNCMPMIPADGCEFAHLSQPAPDVMQHIRAQAGAIMPQMTHCAHCRADACGLIGAPEQPEDILALADCAQMPPRGSENRPYVAVASREGLLVNQHLGEAHQFTIYKQDTSGFAIESIRTAPPPGSGAQRWQTLAALLSDCRAILVSGAGHSPRAILTAHGLNIVEMEGLIEEGLKAAFAGIEPPAAMRRRFMGCGAACKGTGHGCI